MGRQHGISITLPFMMLATGVFAGNSDPHIPTEHCLRMSSLVANRTWQQTNVHDGHGSHWAADVKLKTSGVIYTSKLSMELTLGNEEPGMYDFIPYEENGKTGCRLQRLVERRFYGPELETVNLNSTGTDFSLKKELHPGEHIVSKGTWYSKRPNDEIQRLSNLTLVGLMNEVVGLSSEMIDALFRYQLSVRNKFIGLPLRAYPKAYKACKKFEEVERLKKGDPSKSKYYIDDDISKNYFYDTSVKSGHSGGHYVRSEPLRDAGLIYWTEHQRDPRSWDDAGITIYHTNSVYAEYVFVVLDRTVGCSRVELWEQ